MTPRTTLSRLIQDFFRSHLVARRDVSNNTIHSYRDSFRLLLLFATSKLKRKIDSLVFDDLNRKTVLAFLEDLEIVRGNSASTRNARLAAIHSFFRFVSEEDPLSLDVCRQVLTIPYKRTTSRTLICLDREDVEHILGNIDRGSPRGRRDVALLHFLYNTGARAQEIVDLRLPAVRLSPPAQVRIFGKGRKERLCPIWPETATLILDTLRDRGLNGSEDMPLFLSTAGRPLTRFGLRYIIRSRVLLATQSRSSLARKKITPHTFRHTTALHLLQSGVEMNVVRNWLGHASIETTHAYVEIDMKMKKAALDACGPIKTVKGRPRWIEPGLLSWLEAL